MNEGIKIIARNKRASFDYHIEDSYEAGLVLYGSEIKSVRMNRVNLAEWLRGRRRMVASCGY
jgi:SsrA-binding protein